MSLGDLTAVTHALRALSWNARILGRNGSAGASSGSGSLWRSWTSRLAPLRFILLGHDELAGVVFWASLVGIGGALASVLTSSSSPGSGRTPSTARDWSRSR
jgi:hypothetical protein